MTWEEAVGALLVGFCGVGVCFLAYMSHLLIELNSKVAVLISDIEQQVVVNDDVEGRLRLLEFQKKT